MNVTEVQLEDSKGDNVNRIEIPRTISGPRHPFEIDHYWSDNNAFFTSLESRVCRDS